MKNWQKGLICLLVGITLSIIATQFYKSIVLIIIAIVLIGASIVFNTIYIGERLKSKSK